MFRYKDHYTDWQISVIQKNTVQSCKNITYIYYVIRSQPKDYGCTKTGRRTDMDGFVLVAVRTAAEGPHSVVLWKADTAALLLKSFAGSFDHKIVQMEAVSTDRWPFLFVELWWDINSMGSSRMYSFSVVLKQAGDFGGQNVGIVDGEAHKK